MKDWKTTGSVLVSWHLADDPDKAILLVGEQERGEAKIINAYQGKEALDIREKLLPKDGD